MPYWTYLLEVEGPAASRDGAAIRELAAAADVPPIGWLALFAPRDIATVPARDRARPDRRAPSAAGAPAGAEAYLTLCTSIPAARANLGRRRPVLGAVFRRPVAEWLDLLDEHLAGVDPRRHVQVWLGELVDPWPASARGALEAALVALDGDERQGWCRVAALVLGALRAGSIELSLPPGTQINACVGWLRGEPAPRVADELYPPIDDALARLGERGAGGSYAARLQAVLDELITPEPAAGAEVEALLDRVDDAPPGWLAAELQRAPAALRGAALARGLMLPPEALDYDEPDPRLARAQFVIRLVRATLAAPTPLVLRALHDPDPRVRSILARGYRGDLEDDERVADDDEVWRALVRDPDPRVRVALLHNPCAPARPPADDPSPLVRAHHPETPAAELMRLAGASDLEVLHGVLVNPSAPLRAQRRACAALGLDGPPGVRVVPPI